MLNLNEYKINEYLISKQLQYTTSHAKAPNGYKKNKASIVDTANSITTDTTTTTITTTTNTTAATTTTIKLNS